MNQDGYNEIYIYGFQLYGARCFEKYDLLILKLENSKLRLNDYSLEISINAWDKAFNKGSIFYSSESEFGGIIDSKKVDTSKNVIVFTGKTFRGMLEKEYIQPPEGQAYFVARGEANSVINELIGDNFDSLFTVR